MGADLDILSLYERTRQRYEPRWMHWIQRRDRATTAAARQAAQRQADKYFAKLRSAGYFRDSYNATDVLWLFELSWWGDILPRLDAEDRLSPKEAARLRDALRQCESTFEQNLSKVEPLNGETREEVERYFREKYTNLRAFLTEAIDRGEAITCSL